MAVTKLRLTQSKLLAAIKHAAKSSSNIVFMPDVEKRSMAGLTTFKLLILILQQGEFHGKPKLNKHGDWELSMCRFGAKEWCVIDVIAQCDGPRVRRLIVLHGENHDSI